MYEYKAVIDNVVDGDTIDATLDLGFKAYVRQRMRLAHIDTPERGKPGFAEATQALRDMVLNKTVVIHSTKTSKWGYYLATVRLDDGTDVGQKMVERGLAKPYEGGTKGVA